MKKIQKLLASILTLAFSLMLVSNWPGAANAEENVSAANRYNVVLVMDKSGSLRNAEGVGTDPDGLRYDAMRLFLGLLTETGNNVGVIAFDEEIRYNSGLKSISTMDDKKALVSAVEQLGTSYDTDIGGAVLQATELLRGMKEENGLPCVILLLSDGMTDFTAENIARYRFAQSEASARQALKAAQAEGITIHGILLNVDGGARGGEEEIRFYTDGTRGQMEKVSSPEDLTAAFGRFYAIINKTEYNNAHRIIFPPQGDVETGFFVPTFGVEEVNVIIEHGDTPVDAENVRITAPDGGAYSLDEHTLETSRFLLIKIPQPAAGQWNIALTGTPGDSVAVCMIYNASVSAALRCEAEGDGLEILKPIPFQVVVTDAEEDMTEERLRSIETALVVKNAASGESTRYPMEFGESGYSLTLTFEEGGEYEITAAMRLSDLELRSNTLYLDIAVPMPTVKESRISDLFAFGGIQDGIWELSLDTLFDDPTGRGLRYALSDDLGGAVRIVDGVLRADLNALGGASAFTVTATDAFGQEVSLPFDFAIPAPAAKASSVNSLAEAGKVSDGILEISLAELFDDPAGMGLTYTLSDDLGGAASIENGILRVDLSMAGENAAFSVEAVDANGLRTTIPFDFAIPAPAAKADSVNSLAEAGKVSGGILEINLAELFDDPAGMGLTYTLSDDLNGAASIENGVLRVDLRKAGENAAFSVAAVDANGLRTAIPFDFAIPAPAAKADSVNSISEAGTISDGILEISLAELFDDPAGMGLTYTLSDDLNGAASIENGVLRVDLSKAGENAAFSVEAVDANGLRTTIPFDFAIPVPAAKADSVNSISEAGTISDGILEISLAELFDDPAGMGLTYTLSDDLNGAASIENGILRVDLNKAGENAAFSVEAVDANGLRATLPFDIPVSFPAAKVSGVSDVLSIGQIENGSWTLDLSEIFADESGLTYALSDDLGGAVSIENGVLHAQLDALGENPSFTVTAINADGLRTDLPFALRLPSPEAVHGGVTELSDGSIQDNVWQLDLDALFADPVKAGLSYTLSEDIGDAAVIEDGVLYVDLHKLEGDPSFLVTATDALGHSAQLPIDLTVRFPETKIDLDSDLLWSGRFADGFWELDLNRVFADSAGTGLRFSLPDDLDGTVTIENGILRVAPNGVRTASFRVIATDADGLSAEFPVTLSFPEPTASVDTVSDVSAGHFGEDFWEIDLNGLFEDPKGSAFRYTLSDDLNGAVTIEDGVLRVRPNGADAAAFTVTASDAFGLCAELPFDLRFPAPTATIAGISETVKTGLFQDGHWEKSLTGLFEDPKGSKLEYTLSDDRAGALKIEEETLTADCSGLGEADFSVRATDAFGLHAELPVKLVEQNMTWIILAIALAAILLLILLFFFYLRRAGKKK